MIQPSPELVARYRTRAPRYTSYPAAPHFHPLDPAALDDALARVRGDLSLYVHLPFCTHLCLYCGCHVEIRASREIATPYVDLLLREFDLWLARAPGADRLAQLCLGGGTPTFLRPDQMEALVRGLQARLPWRPDIDASIEIDPRSVAGDGGGTDRSADGTADGTADGAASGEGYLERLVALGFNRFSLGVQDFDPEVMAAVARPQPEHLTRAAVATLRRLLPAADLNLDLMYGLPHQTEATFDRTLGAVTDIRPSRIALFHYAHVPWIKPAQKVLEKRGLPGSDLKARLFSLATDRLLAAGYRVIGMDHFALPGDALLAAQEAGQLQRNFMGYTTHASLDQLGIGVSAIGSFAHSYAQNHKDRETWAARIASNALPVERGYLLSPGDLCRRALIMDLFCNFSAHLSPGDADALAAELARLAPLQADGLVEIHADPAGTRLQVTPLGRHFIRNVCAAFDEKLEADAGQRRYSMTG